MTGRSRLLNQTLPPELAAAARREGVDPDAAWLTTSTDLNLAGKYEPVYLVALPDRFLTLAASAPGQPAVRISLKRQDATDFHTRQGIGGGFLEALVDGVYTEILAFSNARADLFRKVAAKLAHWSKGEMPPVTEDDDLDPRKCPKCGLTLEFRGDVCRRCMKGSAVFLRALTLLRDYRGRVALMISLVFAGICVSLIPQRVIIPIFIDKILAPDQAGNPKLPLEQAVHWLLLMVVVLFGVYLFQAIVQATTGRLASYIGTQMSYDMRSRVFRHLLRMQVGYYDQYNVGQLMSRVVTDAEQMREFVRQLAQGYFAQLVTVLMVGVILFSLNWQLALITLIPAPLVIFSGWRFWKRIYPRYYRVWDANSKLNSALNSILSGIRVVRAFGQEPAEQKRFGKSAAYVRDSFRGVEYTATLFNPSIGFLFQLGGILVWFIGGQWVLKDYGMSGGFTLGKLMAFVGLLWTFYNPLSQLTQLTNWLTQFLTAAQRTFEILDTPPQIIEVKNPRTLPADGGAIRFENVTFGYDRREPIIRNISFDIRPGEHIGIVGKSGSGKTTIVNLLARFYEIEEGRVLIDGIDIRDLKMEDLRQSVGIVLQEPFLFRGTIIDNITYGRSDATTEQVLDAARAANAHDFIMRHMFGYDTYIGERGAGLSGGERQRISIARALLYDPKILILDEATSNVDTESELLIQEALARVTEGRTTIIIAHRLSTLKKSDRILVVDSGQIVEQGTHDELLQKKGIYYTLVKIQTELSREPGVDSPDIPDPRIGPHRWRT